jgi:hypothetical protein
MSENASPRRGDAYLTLDGRDAYVEGMTRKLHPAGDATTSRSTNFATRPRTGF